MSTAGLGEGSLAAGVEEVAPNEKLAKGEAAGLGSETAGMESEGFAAKSVEGVDVGAPKLKPAKGDLDATGALAGV